MIDLSKQYCTTDGRKVRLFADDIGGKFSVVGAIWYEEYKIWEVNRWTKNGRYRLSDLHKLDLIEVKPRIKRTVWMNVYKDDVSVYLRRWEADDMASDNCGFVRFACVKVEIDCEEGEGL